MPVLHHGRCTFKTDLLSLSKYKDKLPDVPVSNQNIEWSCKNKLKLAKLKNLFFNKKMYIAAILKL